MVAAKANLILDSFNLMGYDALGIGDDDLSLGKEFLIELSKKARFPFLSANLLNTETGKPIFQPYLIKEILGVKVGIFSLLSPDTFAGPQDPRLKGLTVQNPVETAQRVARELNSNADLVILLSHQGYPKDVEMAQTVPGIHLIFGGHTGMHLANPPVIKETVILQTTMKGMYAARMDLAFIGKENGFANIAMKRSLENNISNLRLRESGKEVSQAEKDRNQRIIGDIERSIKQLEGKNQFSNTILPLGMDVQEIPDIVKIVEAFKSKFPEPEKSASPKP